MYSLFTIKTKDLLINLLKMKYIICISIIAIGIFTQCINVSNVPQTVYYNDDKSGDEGISLIIELEAGKSYSYPTYVIWIEDTLGNYIRTIFVTKSYATGIYTYEMVNDTTWVNNSGKSIQPAALPVWTYKKGIINNNFIPSPNSPFIDALTGATPSADASINFSDFNNMPLKVFVEVNQICDWNTFWTSSKYSDSPAYRHSAQPSLVYCGTITSEDSIISMTPIGHGDPLGKSAEIVDGVNTLTTAIDIFSSVTIKRK